MKYTIILILTSLLLVSCNFDDDGEYNKEYERRRDVRENIKTSDYVVDDNGMRYKIVTIEGCEHYLYVSNDQMGFAKVDCNCIPDKSERNN